MQMIIINAINNNILIFLLAWKESSMQVNTEKVKYMDMTLNYKKHSYNATVIINH
jgi:hypothetical protein